MCAWPAQALREQDLIAIADAGDPIRYNPGELVALAHPSTAATAFFLVTAGEVMLLPASLQIPPGTTQLDVSKVGGGLQLSAGGAVYPGSGAVVLGAGLARTAAAKLWLKEALTGCFSAKSCVCVSSNRRDRAVPCAVHVCRRAVCLPRCRLSSCQWAGWALVLCIMSLCCIRRQLLCLPTRWRVCRERRWSALS